MKSEVSMNKKPWKKVLNIAAVFLAFLLIGTTVATATGMIHLPFLSDGFKKLVDDDTTKELLEQGAVQEVNITTENEDFTVTFEGLTGDSSTQYGVFKVVDHNGVIGEPSELRLNAKVVGISIVENGELDKYAEVQNEGFTTVDGEENTYYIKVYMPSYWIYQSGEDIYITISSLSAYYGELEYFEDTSFITNADRVYTAPLDFELTFTPDRDVLPKANVFHINQTLISEVSEFTLIDMEVSNYETFLALKFPAKEGTFGMREATGLWYQIDKDLIVDNYIGTVNSLSEGQELTKGILDNDWKEYVIVYTNEEDGTHRVYKSLKNELIPLEGRVKLFVDGVEIPRLPKQSAYASEYDLTVSPAIWSMPVTFEPFDVEAANSIEIRYLDQVVVLK